jgi:hypothetical protein
MVLPPAVQLVFDTHDTLVMGPPTKPIVDHLFAFQRSTTPPISKCPTAMQTVADGQETPVSPA